MRHLHVSSEENIVLNRRLLRLKTNLSVGHKFTVLNRVHMVREQAHL